MITSIIAIPVILGVVSAIKTAGMPSRWSAPLAIVLGAVVSYFLAGHTGQSVFDGIVWGLSAAGLYSGTSAVIAKPVSSEQAY